MSLVHQRLQSDRPWMTLWALLLGMLPMPFGLGAALAVYYAIWPLLRGEFDILWVWAIIGGLLATLYCLPPVLLLRAAWTSDTTLALRRRRRFWRVTMGLLAGTLAAAPFALLFGV